MSLTWLILMGTVSNTLVLARIYLHLMPNNASQLARIEKDAVFLVCVLAILMAISKRLGWS